MLNVGEVWRHACFYQNAESGEFLPKYMVVLAIRNDGDVIFRLLTSQSGQRQAHPSCYHGAPYPYYYLGIITPNGPHLNRETWLDLREQEEDFDARDFEKLVANGTLTLVHQFSHEVVCPLLACAAHAPDTTARQARLITNVRAAINCPAA